MDVQTIKGGEQERTYVMSDLETDRVWGSEGCTFTDENIKSF